MHNDLDWNAERVGNSGSQQKRESLFRERVSGHLSRSNEFCAAGGKQIVQGEVRVGNSRGGAVASKTSKRLQ